MRFFKWSVFFIISFFISWVVISTFSQSQFGETAPAKVIFYTTPSIPVYFFIIGAFFLGLFIGLVVAVYNLVTQMSNAGKNRRYAQQLEKEVEHLKIQLDQSEPHTDTVKENFQSEVEAEAGGGHKEISQENADNEQEYGEGKNA